jgi:hypothetical protein
MPDEVGPGAPTGWAAGGWQAHFADQRSGEWANFVRLRARAASFVIFKRCALLLGSPPTCLLSLSKPSIPRGYES